MNYGNQNNKIQNNKIQIELFKENMKLSDSNKVVLLRIGIIFCILTIFSLLAFIVFNQIESNKKQLAIESQIIKQKDLLDGIVRSQNEYASQKDLEQLIKDNKINLKAIKEDLDKLKADITTVNIVLVGSLGQKGTNIPSTGTGPKNPNPDPEPKCEDGKPCPNADPFGYLKRQQDLALNEAFGNVKVPIGSVGFSAWQEKPWSIDIKPREYKMSSVIGKDENQRSFIYNKVSVNVDGKEHDLPIKSAVTKEQYPEAKWSLLNPRLFLGVDGGVSVNPIHGELTPSVNLGVMSYGQFKNQPDFSVLEVGVGFGTISQRPQISVTPVTYNVGKHIPFMNNLYVGPSIHVGTDANVSAMFGVRVGL
jgi:hypothetical protein